MKKLFLICLILLSVLSASAETWTPVGEVQWTEGAITGQSTSYHKTWKVLAERSDTRPSVFRLQPYASNPFSSISSSNYSYRADDVYVYIHVDNSDKVWMESYRYFSDIYNYDYYYFHIWQRCPENGFDSNFYGTISNNTTIEFPIGSFVSNYNRSSSLSAPTSDAQNSTYIHKIVFPKGILNTETWVSIGKGQWEDSFWVWTSDNSPVKMTLDFEKCVQNPNVYRTKPYEDSGYVKIYTQNPSKVFIDPYSHVNSSGNIMVVTQRCTENGVNESYYGTFNDGIITIPGNYFRSNKQGSNSYSNGSADRQCVISLPEGYNRPIYHMDGLYMGIISFNDKIETLPMSILNQQTESTFTNFVNNMEMANATLLYYAVDQAITAIGQPIYPDNLSNAVIITFTDGLDQGSLAMKPELLTSRNYAQHLSERIASTSVKGHKLQAYCIGLKSDDVVDDELFQQNLESLSSAPENALPVTDIGGVQTELVGIYEDLHRQTSQRVVSIVLPMMEHGNRYRFTLDGTTDNEKVNDSKVWIEGIFNINDYSLNDVQYHGFTSTSGEKIIVERDGVYVKLTFTDCRDENGGMFEVKKEDIKQWYYIVSSNKWNPNSENEKDGEIEIEDVRTSAAIMFVLDSSISLGDLFPVLKMTANTFINRLVGGDGDLTGVEDVMADGKTLNGNAPVEYYNLQGVRVLNPQKGIFIRRQGNVVSKIMVR